MKNSKKSTTQSSESQSRHYYWEIEKIISKLTNQQEIIEEIDNFKNINNIDWSNSCFCRSFFHAILQDKIEVAENLLNKGIVIDLNSYFFGLRNFRSAFVHVINKDLVVFASKMFDLLKIYLENNNKDISVFIKTNIFNMTENIPYISKDMLAMLDAKGCKIDFSQYKDYMLYSKCVNVISHVIDKLKKENEKLDIKSLTIEYTNKQYSLLKAAHLKYFNAKICAYLIDQGADIQELINEDNYLENAIRSLNTEATGRHYIINPVNIEIIKLYLSKKLHVRNSIKLSDEGFKILLNRITYDEHANPAEIIDILKYLKSDFLPETTIKDKNNNYISSAFEKYKLWNEIKKKQHDEGGLKYIPEIIKPNLQILAAKVVSDNLDKMNETEQEIYLKNTNEVLIELVTIAAMGSSLYCVDD